jgi:CheY-like chemotaxis protein
MFDMTFILYLLIFFTSLSGFLIFTWWWYKNQGATVVYAYITLLFASESVVHFIHAVGRYYRMIGEIDSVSALYNSVVWPSRLVFHFFILLAIVIHVSHRIYLQVKRRKAFLKRKFAHPDEDFKEEILIIDDNEAVAEVLEKTLRLVFPNIVIHSVPDAEKALKLFRRDVDINLVLTDIYLPGGISGFEFCKIVKEECPWTIIIAMTGYPDKYEFWTARAAGFDDYFQKPFDVKSLIDTVRREFETLERWKLTKTKHRMGGKK